MNHFHQEILRGVEQMLASLRNDSMDQVRVAAEAINEAIRQETVYRVITAAREIEAEHQVKVELQILAAEHKSGNETAANAEPLRASTGQATAGGLKEQTVTVNGRKYAVEAGFLTYEEVVRLSGKGGSGDLTVTFTGGPPWRPQGSLSPGESVLIHEGSVFDATFTGHA